MLSKTKYTVDPKLIQLALKSFETEDFRTTINQPTGNFFYDPWVIKPEYKGTVWELLLNAIEEPIGEARIISLNPKMSYQAHADIDDRFHLNLAGEESYLSDLESRTLHKLTTDGIWYLMNAGKVHTASNFGRIQRVQLVVRQNLKRGSLTKPVRVKLLSNIPSIDDSRFLFDSTVSPWLNLANKNGIIDNFSYSPTCVEFDVEETSISELTQTLGNNFRIE
jgi:hypothetical protein